MLNNRRHLGVNEGFNSGKFGLSTVGGVFSIDHSFLLDGSNEYFDIPNADLSSILQGNVQKSITFVFYYTGGAYPTLWSNGNTNRGLYFLINDSTGAIAFQWNNLSDSGKYVLTDPAVINKNEWNVLTFNVDTTNGSSIMLNGSDLSIDTDQSIGNDVISNTHKFSIGKGGVAGLSYFMGYMQQVSINKILTLSEHQTLYNSGKPLNPQTLYGVDNHYYFNTDNSGSTAQFVVSDSVNSIDATSVNLEDADKTTFTNY